MVSCNYRKLAPFIAATLIAAALAPHTAAGEGNDIPEATRSALAVPLQNKVKQLLEMKNDEGINNVRGSYFRRYVKVDDDTYQVVFHMRTAGEEELVTERYLLTLKRNPSSPKKWEIAEEELQNTVRGVLFRAIPGDETFHAFDSFKFDREGMSVSADNGTMYIDYWRGKPTRISLAANNLHYNYAPPQDLSFYEVSLIVKRTERYHKDIVFNPERVTITCSDVDCEEILAESFTGQRPITVDGLDNKIAQLYRENLEEQKKNRREYPMSGYVGYLEPDRRWYNLAVKRQGSEHWARLSYDSFAPEEVEFGVTRLGDWSTFGFPLYSYYSEETRQSGIPPHDLEKRPDQDALYYDVVSIEGNVDMAIEDADTMNCDVTYKLRVKKPLDIIDFRINQVRGNPGEREETKRPSMIVHLLEDGNGEELTYIRRGAAAGWVVLPERAEVGEELTVRVKFVNTNSLYKLNPSYSYVNRSGWLPFVRFGDMIDDFDLRIRVPKRYQILGIGHKVSDKTHGDLRTARYRAESPVVFPTIIFGDYQVDEPRFKAEKLDGTEIPVRIYADRTSMMSFSQWSSFEEAVGEINSGIQEIRPDSLRPIAEQAANALNLFREVYGVDYPYGKLDLVNDPIGPGFYGQAPASIIYLGAGVFRATGEVAHFGGTLISKFKESVVAHEVGHQWWGSLVTMGNRRNYWFVESLAEYSSALFVESLYGAKSPEKGRKAYLEKVEEWRRDVLEAGALSSVQASDTVWSGGDLPGQARTALIYNQGPYAFHMLRELFGDEKFFKFLRDLAGELQGKEIVTRDIQSVAEESFGGIDADGDPYKVDLEWFFNQWIRGVGIPQFAFDYELRESEDGAWLIEGNIKQRVVAGNKRNLELVENKHYRGVVDITATTRKGQEFASRIVIDGSDTRFQLKVPEKPVEVALNKHGGMLSHENVVNQGW